MTYQCPACGYRTARWMGFCPQCRSGGLRETGDAPAAEPTAIGAVASDEAMRFTTGMGEIDRVLGGGLVAGSALLLGGEPGVGKSTLLLQVAAAIARGGGTALVATAEESAAQVAMRARRLGAVDPGVSLVAERELDRVLAAARLLRPDLVVLDSVQAVSTDAGGGPGSVAQVRDCAARVVQFAKEEDIAVAMVGHVTKDGGIAGPKVVEHLVDVVLYLDGEAELGMRVVRSIKNRFGATHHAGLFEMGESGLVEVGDPSRALVGDWRGNVAGTVVFPTLEGRRPMLVEIQALVSRATAPQPRRSVRGLEAARVHQLLAVLDRHARLSFAGADVYVSAVGGVRLREPAADLPVALALASSLLARPLGSVAAWGEVGLTGEVRPVTDAARRRGEAERLGVARVVAPAGDRDDRIGRVLAEAGVAPGLEPVGLPAAAPGL